MRNCAGGTSRSSDGTTHGASPKTPIQAIRRKDSPPTPLTPLVTGGEGSSGVDAGYHGSSRNLKEEEELDTRGTDAVEARQQHRGVWSMQNPLFSASDRDDLPSHGRGDPTGEHDNDDGDAGDDVCEAGGQANDGSDNEDDGLSSEDDDKYDDDLDAEDPADDGPAAEIPSTVRLFATAGQAVPGGSLGSGMNSSLRGNQRVSMAEMMRTALAEEQLARQGGQHGGQDTESGIDLNATPLPSKPRRGGGGSLAAVGRMPVSSAEDFRKRKQRAMVQPRLDASADLEDDSDGSKGPALADFPAGLPFSKNDVEDADLPEVGEVDWLQVTSRRR